MTDELNANTAGNENTAKPGGKTSFILGFIPLIGWLVVGVFLPLVAFAGWLVGILKAAKGKRYKFPFIGDYAERYLN